MRIYFCGLKIAVISDDFIKSVGPLDTRREEDKAEVEQKRGEILNERGSPRIPDQT